MLFDEIEKAHPDVWNSLLQILEEGRLTDGQGHVVDFRNTVLIMTSNIGTRFARRAGPIGFQLPNGDISSDEEMLRDEIRDALKKTFRPEFLNRVDEIIIFHNLTQEHMLEIVDLQMEEVGARLQEQDISLTLTAAAREWLANKGYDPQFGARPLRRAVQRYIENPLSIQLLSGHLLPGTVVADVAEDAIVFRPADSAPEQEQPAADREPATGHDPEETPEPTADRAPAVSQEPSAAQASSTDRDLPADEVPADQTVSEPGD